MVIFYNYVSLPEGIGHDVKGIQIQSIMSGDCRGESRRAESPFL